MTLYSLDTNICISLLKGEQVVANRLRQLQQSQLKICSIVRAELYYGARKSARVQENLVGHSRFLDAFDTLLFDDLSAEYYGSIRAELERAGTPIGGNDMLIAAIARANDCVLVTRNHREFLRVPGLRVETW